MLKALKSGGLSVKNNAFSKFKLIYGIILAVSVTVAGICLIAACLNLYYAGDGYSAEAVSNYFAPISVPVYVCVILTVAGFVISAFGSEGKKKKSEKVYSYVLEILSSKKDVENADAESAAKVLKERKLRKAVTAAVCVTVCICGAVFLVYALDGSHFHTSEINDSMISAMQVFAPCLAISFISALTGIIVNEKSIKREIELLKQFPSINIKENQNGSEPGSNTDSKDSYKKRTFNKNAIFTTVKIAILVIAAVALVYGAIAGGTADVLTKAVNICTECIGLG